MQRHGWLPWACLIAFIAVESLTSTWCASRSSIHDSPQVARSDSTLLPMPASTAQLRPASYATAASNQTPRALITTDKQDSGLTRQQLTHIGQVFAAFFMTCLLVGYAIGRARSPQ